MSELLEALLAKSWGLARARSDPRAPTSHQESRLPEVVEAEKTKGFQKVGGGSPTQSENFTESRFQAIFKNI